MVEQRRRGGDRTSGEDEHTRQHDTDAVRLQDLVLSTEEAGEFLTELAVMAAERCSRPDGQVECGITVIRRRRPSVAAASGRRAKALDELQNLNGDGPCLSALRAGHPIQVDDLSTEERWPGYAPAAVANGVRSVLAVPLTLEGEAQAVLNLYSDLPRGFSTADVETVRAFSKIASRSLKLALVVANLRESRDDLTEAMRSRTAIDMAIGAIMAQNRCAKNEAFNFLVRASNTRNVKLREVAVGVIRSISGEDAIDTHFDH